ncbi:MAG: hypothetical protein AAFV19_12560 [Pseudomonadota bacterium]
MTALDAVSRDIDARGGAAALADWERLVPRVSAFACPAKQVILSAAQVADRLLFVTAGIAASEQVYPDGTAGIARFFEPGHICTNVTSAWERDIAEDTLIAITPVEGVMMPLALFMEEYLDGGAFGRYLRQKLLDVIAFDKAVICAKTLTRTEDRYRFLETQYADVITQVPAKDIARFLGVTPQGLSRFLRQRRESGGGERQQG